jgi:hypothetical protein
VNRGEVWLAEAGRKRRPVLVLTRSEVIDVRALVTVVEITTSVRNIGAEPLRMLYCYGPAGDVAHWRQELEGTLPRAGIDAPPLPPGAWPQHTEP